MIKNLKYCALYAVASIIVFAEAFNYVFEISVILALLVGICIVNQITCYYDALKDKSIFVSAHLCYYIVLLADMLITMLISNAYVYTILVILLSIGNSGYLICKLLQLRENLLYLK